MPKKIITVYNGNMELLSPVNSAKARMLLKKKKAKVICNHPFTLRLLYVKEISKRDKEIITNSIKEKNHYE